MRDLFEDARRLAALLAVTLVVAAALAACSPSQPSAPASPRPLTTEEGQRLATTRFLNYNAGSRSIRATVPVGNQSVQLDGWVDYTAHTGYATATGPDFSPQLLRWNLGTVALRPGSAAQTAAPGLPMPTGGWHTRTLDPQRSDLDTVLLVVNRLGSDRPENPLLLQQEGALWMAAQDLDGTPITIFAAPPSDRPASAAPDPDASGLRLWVDGSGLLHRAQVRTSTGWVDVDFGSAAGVSLPPLPTPSTARSSS